MRIAFHTPFKPLDHPRVSGDVTIAGDMARFLAESGNEIVPMRCPSSRLLWTRPRDWPSFVRAGSAALAQAVETEAWFTYHSYYKSPDMLGPCARRRGVPYFVFSGSHAPKRFWNLKTAPGYLLNTRALTAADHVFANKLNDLKGLRMLLPPERVSYVRCGIHVGDFTRSPSGREALRREWGIPEGRLVVSSAALFRPGVKAEGLKWVIRACARLVAQGHDIALAIAGDGPSAPDLKRLAGELLPERTIFAGLVPRHELRRFFSAGDLFAFPGLNEGLGMVYLEAEACGLPAVATDDRGAPEVVSHGESGFITPTMDEDAFTAAIARLLSDRAMRDRMGVNAATYVRARHDVAANSALMLETMRTVIHRKRHPQGHSK